MAVTARSWGTYPQPPCSTWRLERQTKPCAKRLPAFSMWGLSTHLVCTGFESPIRELSPEPWSCARLSARRLRALCKKSSTVLYVSISLSTWRIPDSKARSGGDMFTFLILYTTVDEDYRGFVLRISLYSIYGYLAVHPTNTNFKVKILEDLSRVLVLCSTTSEAYNGLPPANCPLSRCGNLAVQLKCTGFETKILGTSP